MEAHDVTALLKDLKAGAAWKRGERSARTLSGRGALRVTLAALPEGATLSPHRVEGPASVHVLEGRIRFGAEEEEVVLSQGTVLALPPGVLHTVTALEASALLVTVALPPGQTAASSRGE